VDVVPKEKVGTAAGVALSPPKVNPSPLLAGASVEDVDGAAAKMNPVEPEAGADVAAPQNVNPPEPMEPVETAAPMSDLAFWLAPGPGRAATQDAQAVKEFSLKTKQIAHLHLFWLRFFQIFPHPASEPTLSSAEVSSSFGRFLLASSLDFFVVEAFL